LAPAVLGQALSSSNIGLGFGAALPAELRRGQFTVFHLARLAGGSAPRIAARPQLSVR
jgi:hypothetical protein